MVWTTTSASHSFSRSGLWSSAPVAAGAASPSSCGLGSPSGVAPSGASSSFGAAPSPSCGAAAGASSSCGGAGASSSCAAAAAGAGASSSCAAAAGARNGNSSAHGKYLWLHAPRRRRRLLQSRLYSCMWRWLRCRTCSCGPCSTCWRCCRRRIPPAHGLHGQEGYIKVPLFQQ